jgi:aminocarboxymuconate-semialdehyde decarboxylase
VQRYGDEHVLLGTDYPFAARESPAGAVLREPHDRLTSECRAAIGAGNARALARPAGELSRLPNPMTRQM